MKLPRRIASRYARALADLTEARGEAEEVKKELEQFASIFAQGTGARRVFDAPAVPKGEKRAALERIIERTRPLKTTANFLRLLLDNHRLSHLAEVVEAYADELDRRAAVVEAEIATARPVPAELQTRLVGALEKRLGKRVRPRWRIEPGLIGGARARVGSLVLDGSVRAKLERFRHSMLSGPEAAPAASSGARPRAAAEGFAGATRGGPASRLAPA